MVVLSLPAVFGRYVEYYRQRGQLRVFLRRVLFEIPPARAEAKKWEKIEGKIGKPEDLAAAICYIASDEARFTNGTTLVVDGGRLDIL